VKEIKTNGHRPHLCGLYAAPVKPSQFGVVSDQMSRVSSLKSVRVFKWKATKRQNALSGNVSDDGVDRRGFLECVAWAGSGLLWTISGGIDHSQVAHLATRAPTGSLNFVSD
jgi:hypothetical protein